MEPSDQTPKTVFETPRLKIRRASVLDAGFYTRLWTCPEVMRNVGFPEGLPITQEEIEKKLQDQPDSDLDRLLVVILKTTGEPIGECKMYTPDEEGVSETDVKLLPEFWGRGYGREIKSGLLDQLFARTVCECVQATPNVKNTSSIIMQESVGGVRIGEDTYEFPEEMRSFTVPVRHYIYRVYRETWENRKAKKQ